MATGGHRQAQCHCEKEWPTTSAGERRRIRETHFHRLCDYHWSKRELVNFLRLVIFKIKLDALCGSEVLSRIMWHLVKPEGPMAGEGQCPPGLGSPISRAWLWHVASAGLAGHQPPLLLWKPVSGHQNQHSGDGRGCYIWHWVLSMNFV